MPCTLAAVALPPWDVARERPHFLDTSLNRDFVALFYVVLRISRRLAACTLSSRAPPLGASVVAAGYGLLPAGSSCPHAAKSCLLL